MIFLEGNIFSRFGFPKKLVTDNAQVFKFASMVEFYGKYNIKLSHSTPYYPQGNVLAKSSKKCHVRIMMKLLTENKRSWDSTLKFSLWTDGINTMKSIGTTPFQIIYWTDAILSNQLGLPVLKFLEEKLEELNDIQRTIFQIVDVQQKREKFNEEFEAYQSKVNASFDKKTKKENFKSKRSCAKEGC
jgi:hypothetical protein